MAISAPSAPVMVTVVVAVAGVEHEGLAGADIDGEQLGIGALRLRT